MNDERGLEPIDHFIARSRAKGCECGCAYFEIGDPGVTNQVNLSEFASNMWDIMDRCGNLLIDKQEDYGPLNIARAPGGPLNGLRVRIYDKVARINNLIDTGATPNNESLEDSFTDLANYAVIALMVLNGTWPALESDI